MRQDDGQITVLTIGFVIVLGLLTVLVVNASAAFTERRDVLALADRAALTAADGLARDSVYRDGLTDSVVLDPAEARRLIADIMPTGTRAEVVVAESTVTVRLERDFAAPLVPPGWSEGAVIVAESTAQLHLAAPDVG